MIALMLFLFTPEFAADPGKQPEVEFRLKNGLKVILVPQPGHAVAVVALGIQAGTYNDPEGRCGLAHLTEHLFFYGASKSYPAHRAFEALARDGPLGLALQDTNAETLWNLTYYYSARPAKSVDVALEAFADKLSGVTVTKELIEAERKKVLTEIEFVSTNLKRNPAIRKLMEREARYPKAGIDSHVRGLSAEHVEKFLAQHYRPDRAVLLVQGAIDADRVRKRVEALFGPCTSVKGAAISEGPVKDVPEQVAASYPCAHASPREHAALRLAGAAWVSELQKNGRAYFEAAPGGTMNVVLFDADAEPLRKGRDSMQTPLSDEAFRAARTRAGEKARTYKNFVAVNGNPQSNKDVKACIRAMLQSAIDRLRFEAEGGQAYLDDLEALSSQDVAAAAKKFFNAQAEQVRKIQP